MPESPAFGKIVIITIKSGSMLKFLLLFPLLLVAEPTREERIQQLKEEIRELKIRAMNDEVKGQENLRYHGNVTVTDVENAENYEVEAAKKEAELKVLLEKR